MLPLPDQYTQLMEKIGGTEMLGIVVEDCTLLRDLVRLSYRMHLLPFDEAVDCMKQLVLGALASTFTYRNDQLESGAEFPSKLGLVDQERWWVGLRYLDKDERNPSPTSLEALERIAPGRYDRGNLRSLRTQLACRVGDCATYSITLGILLASAPLCSEVRIFGKPPHAWVRAQQIGIRYLDLARESHGQLELHYRPLILLDEKEASIQYNLTTA